MRRIETWFRQNTTTPKKSVHQGQISTPFVGHNHPFIRSITPHKPPFICLNIPFVGIGKFLRVQLGVTLIEMMITLAIFAIIGAFALPNFRQTLLNHGTTANANEFLVDLNFARSEALKRSLVVEVCVPDAAQTACDFSGNWSTGRIIGVRLPIAAGGGFDIIRVKEPLPGMRTLREPVTAYTSVSFDGSGLATFRDSGGIGPGGITAVFALCHDRDNDAVMDPEVGRDIRISPTGSVKIFSPATAC